MKTAATLTASPACCGFPRVFLAALAAAWLTGTLSPLRAGDTEPAEKLPAPLAFSASATPPGVFEKQFRIDTGESERTRRSEIERPLPLPVGEKQRQVLHFDLAAWPAAQRSTARVWVAVSAPSTITTEGPLHVSFSQGGVGLSTGIDNTFNIDGVILMGCDYAVSDGAVAVEIDNVNHLVPVACTLHAIVYAPAKVAAPESAKK